MEFSFQFWMLFVFSRLMEIRENNEINQNTDPIRTKIQRAPKFQQQVQTVPEEKGQINSAREGKAIKPRCFNIKLS